MIMSKSLQLALCDTQGQLFELAAERGYSSETFIKAFMTSQVAADMDKDFHHVQWAGKAYILSRMEDELADQLTKEGEIYDKETLYWAGYIYRYWNFYNGESSREIYKQAPTKTMKVVYLMYHTMSPEMAIDRLKESYEAIDKAKKIKDAEDTIQNINELLADSALFRRQADSLYDKISKNFDYAPFIATAKAASGMGGNIPFKQLPYQPKRNALVMIRDAIKVYVAKTIVD
jgi:hypothetical protein